MQDRCDLTSEVGKWTSTGQLKYYVHLASKSNTIAEATTEVMAYLKTAYLNALPCIPAVNKWNKVYAPLAWFMFGVNFCFLVPMAFLQLKQEEEADRQFIADIDAIDPLGPTTEEAYRKIQHGRWEKTARWLNAEGTVAGLTTGTIIFNVGLPFMAKLFTINQHLNTYAGSIIPFMIEETSPAIKLLCHFYLLINQGDHVVWAPLQPWSPAMLHNTACSVWS